MKANTRSALTPLDLCTLIAHETVSLLNADAEALDSALRLRTGLDVYAAASELGKGHTPPDQSRPLAPGAGCRRPAERGLDAVSDCGECSRGLSSDAPGNSQNDHRDGWAGGYAPDHQNPRCRIRERGGSSDGTGGCLPLGRSWVRKKPATECGSCSTA